MCSSDLAAVRVKDARGRIKGVETISVGSGFGCLSRRDGSAWCWGDGFWGNLGDGRSESSKVAVRVIARGGLPRVRQVSAGESHACAATVSGSAFCWGSNLSGELGTGTHKKSPIAVQVRRGAKALGKVTSVSAGNTFSCAWQGAPQAVWCWGANESGEVGDGTGDDQYVAVKVLFSFP